MYLALAAHICSDGQFISSFEDNIKVPGGVLRYISDGEVRSPFLGFKLVILDFF